MSHGLTDYVRQVLSDWQPPERVSKVHTRLRELQDGSVQADLELVCKGRVAGPYGRILYRGYPLRVSFTVGDPYDTSAGPEPILNMVRLKLADELAVLTGDIPCPV